MLIDLQLHSTYSDGYLTPSEVAELINGQGVRVASLTDHNTVGGLEEFRIACRKHKIKPITGLELYLKSGNRKFNMLWYNFDDHNPELHDILRNSQRRRRRLMRLALERLVKRGFRIDINKTLDNYNHYAPINHIVDDICADKKNMAKIRRELRENNPREDQIIVRYFHSDKIGKLRNSFIDLSRILKLRKKIGGQLVLCHPAKHSYVSREALVKHKKQGIDGVEILSPHHSYGAIVDLQQLAGELDMITTGGSDFHRFEGSRHLIQKSWDYFTVDSRLLKGLKKIIS